MCRCLSGECSDAPKNSRPSSATVLREEELKTFDDSPEDPSDSHPKDDNEEENKEDGMDVDEENEEKKEPYLDMDYEFMSYTRIKELGKTKDVFERDDPFPLNMYSKK